MMYMFYSAIYFIRWKNNQLHFYSYNLKYAITGMSQQLGQAVIAYFLNLFLLKIACTYLL